MEYRTVSTKLPSDESTMFRVHCEKKGVTPANLIRGLILREMKITVPNIIAGRNTITYERDRDAFNWSIILDDDKKIQVLQNISPYFVEDLNEELGSALRERYVFINKKKGGSVPIPSTIIREGQ